MRSLAISASAYPESQEAAVQVVEAFSRAAVGLALDGITVTVQLSVLEEDE